MIGCNYRIVEDLNGTLGIHKVSYGDTGHIAYCDSNPVDLSGYGNLDGLLNAISLMNKAIKYPIITVEDI